MADVEAVYGDRKRKAELGDIVMTSPGDVRGIVIGVKGSFVTIIAIATKKDTGVTFVLKPAFTKDFPASDCILTEKETLT